MTDIIVINALRMTAKEKFDRLAKDFPAQPMGKDPVRKRFQSVVLDWFSFGLSVHLAVDEQYLHMEPTRFARLFGGRAVSIPWDAFEAVNAGKWRTKAKIGMMKFEGPTWALALAASPQDPEDPLNG